MAEESPSAELAGWYGRQYSEHAGLGDVEGGAEFLCLTKGALSDPNAPSGRIRVFAQYLALLRLPPLTGELEPTPITASAGDCAPVVAVLFSVPGQPPSYAAWGASMESRDGEFRPYFTPIDALLGYSTPLEPEILDAAGLGQLEVVVRTDADWGRETRAGVVAVCALLDKLLGAFSAGQAPPHLSHDIQAFLGDVCQKAPALAAKAAALHSSDKSFTKTVDDNSPQAPPCAKLVPLFVGELSAPGDLRYGTWREAAVGHEAAKLVLNFVSPSFALTMEGAFCVPAGPGLFNNGAMRLRYARSREAARMIDALREARRELAVLGANRRSIHAATVDAFALEALEHAQGFLRVSGAAFLLRTEFVGFTLGELEARVAYQLRYLPPEHHPRLRGLQESLADLDTGARHLFEWAYGLHCLHCRARAAHADIHSNNLTLFDWRPEALPRTEGSCVAYIAGPRGEADAYLFPADGCTSVVIDFSRAVLGPGFPGAGEAFYRDQVGRALRAVHRHSPDFVLAHQAELKALIISSFELVFPLVCAGDLIALGGAFASVVEGLAAAPPPSGEGPGPRPFRLRVAPGLAALGRALEAEGRRFLAEGLALVAAAAGGDARPLAALGFPGAAALPRVFGAWRFPRWAAADPGRLRRAAVVDAYRADRPLRYAPGAPGGSAACPPWADPAEIARHLGPLPMGAVFPEGLPGAAPAPPDPAPARLAAAERAAQAAADALPPPPPGAPPPPAPEGSWIEN